MPVKPRVLEQVLEAYREGDLDECIRLVRTLVEAAPQATAPRQLLAALFAATGNGRLALAHYRRLLPDAIMRGEVIRSIAFQKQIDVYAPPETLAPGRWMVLQKQLRERGLPFLTEAPGAIGRPWNEGQLLALPRAWFERIAAETRYEILGTEPRTVDVEAGTVWEILSGRMRWSFALADGRASAEALAAEGDTVHLDPGLARTACVTLVPELPVEALRFEAGLASDLRLALTAGLTVAGGGMPGLTPEARALLPIRPRRREDFDDAPRPPVPGGDTEPLRLPTPAGDAEHPRTAPGDGAGWVEFGVLSLSGPPRPTDGEDPGQAVDDVMAGRDDTVADHAQEYSGDAAALPPTGPEPGQSDEPAAPEALPASADGSSPAEAVPDAWDAEDANADTPGLPDAIAGRSDLEPGEPAPDEVPVFETPEAQQTAAASAAAPGSTDGADPVDAAEALVRPAGNDPIAGSIGDTDAVVERRRHPRVTVSFASRVALLRLAGSGLDPVEGQMGDLSTSGFSIRFTNRELGASRGALADAVVAVDMSLPGPQGGLRVAAQVRWLDVEEIRDDARMGIEFVLLTETDRRRIAGTLARAALALREQVRKAA